jgi:hypothetical protein
MCSNVKLHVSLCHEIVNVIVRGSIVIQKTLVTHENYRRKLDKQPYILILYATHVPRGEQQQTNYLNTRLFTQL